MPYKQYSCEGYTFVFKYDDASPELLQIYARHLTSPEDAIEVWFEANVEVWNARYRRFESSKGSRTLYWYWIKEDSVVMVVSCF